MTSRSLLALFLTVALLVNGVWHVAHADFHAHAAVAEAADQPSSAIQTSEVDHSGDTLVHPPHCQAFIYRVALAAPVMRADVVADAYLNRFVPGYTSRLLRPPAR